MDRDTGTYCRRCFGESGGCAECAVKDERARLREKVEAICSRYYYVECYEGFDAIRALLAEDANG